MGNGEPCCFPQEKRRNFGGNEKYRKLSYKLFTLSSYFFLSPSRHSKWRWMAPYTIKMNKFTGSSTKTRISLITYKAFRDIFSLFQDGRIVESLGDARSVTHNYAFILTQLIKPESSFFLKMREHVNHFDWIITNCRFFCLPFLCICWVFLFGDLGREELWLFVCHKGLELGSVWWQKWNNSMKNDRWRD